MRQGIIWKKEKKEKERDWQRLRQRDRKKTNNPENEAAHYVFSSKFCRITLKVTDVKRKEVHTQKGRIILGRLVRGGGREPGELVHRCRSGTCMHPFIHSFIHSLLWSTGVWLPVQWGPCWAVACSFHCPEKQQPRNTCSAPHGSGRMERLTRDTLILTSQHNDLPLTHAVLDHLKVWQSPLSEMIRCQRIPGN